MTPLLSLDDARIDVDGVPTCDGLTLRTTADRVLVLGAPRSVFEATCALRPVVRGHLAVRGQDPGDAVRDLVIAGAPLDPALPPKWTPLEYATWSSRLAGHRAAEAKALAADAIRCLQLEQKAKTPIGRLSVHGRRGVVVAAAIATGASVIALEDPTGGLPEETARTWARLLVAGLGDRAFLVFAPRVPLTSPLALNAEEAIVVSGSRVDAQGAPAEIAAAERRFIARVHGPVESLAQRLAERGARLQQEGARVIVDLGETLGTADLLGLCGEAQVTVVELYPVARALA